jgi:ABC-type multidrug transport system fused ATPase/permease subunit
MIPRLIDRERRGALAVVLLMGLCEAGCLAGAALAVGWAIATASPAALGSALGFSAFAAAVSWGRQVAAEDFGARYSGALRRFLAEDAVRAAGAGRPGRLGVMAARLAGDLTAMRDWASVGLSEAVAAGGLLLAAMIVLFTAVGLGGLLIGAGALLPLAFAAGLLAAPLRTTHEELRQARGRVAGLSGDLVQATRTVWALQAFRREAKRLDKRSNDLRIISVRRRVIAAGVGVQAVMVVGVGGACAIWFAWSGLVAPLTPSDWPPILFGLSFLASCSAGFARALDAALAYRAGFRRLSGLTPEDEGDDFTVPHSVIAAPAPVQESPGHVYWVGAAAPLCAQARLEAVWAAGCGTDRQRRKRILVSPTMPLIRASLGRNLSLGARGESREALNAALATVGLNPSDWPLDRFIDPLDPNLDAWTQARLRLARGVAHRPEALYVAEPLLAALPEYAAMLSQIGRSREIAVIALNIRDGAEGLAALPDATVF